jgi:hypothetical protein
MSQDEWVDDPSDDGDWADDDSMVSSPKTSKLESAVRGAGQGLSLGFWDELAGAGEALGQSVGVKGLGDSDWSQVGLTKPLALDPDRDFGQAYTEGRDKWRGEDKIAKKENPYSYGTGEVAGSVASSFLPGLNVAKGASLANIAGKSALSGGLSGAGYSEADNLGDLAKDTGTGAGIGLVAGGTLGVLAPKVGEALDYGVSRLKGGADDVAERLAGRALGAERGTIKKLGYDKVKQAGRYALDNGVLSPLANTDDLISRNQALMDKGGEMMGKAYQAVDDAGASTFNPLDIASKVDEELGGFYRSPINRGETAQLENTIESILVRGEGNIPLSEAQSLKQELGKVANWKNKLVLTDKEKMARQAYGIVNGAIDDAMKNGADAIENAGLKDILAQGKKLYGNASTAEELLQNKQAREQGNKILGLTDWGVLGTGGAAAPLTGGASIPATAALLGTKKGLEKYGAQNGALLLDKVSKQLMKSPQFSQLYQKNPQAFNNMAMKMVQKMMPEEKKDESPLKAFDSSSLINKVQGTKYADVLQKAQQRGDTAFGAANYILQSTDPEYRKHVFGSEDQN